MRVIVQPSYGNATARRHWQDTLAQEVRFTHGRHAAALTAGQLQALRDLHPSGAARFWGAQEHHNAKMESIERGDVVLFTGRNHIRGIGEVGVPFRNRTFADLLWAPDPERGSWLNVYSLRTFQPAEIPYAELRTLLGSAPNDVFMALRIVSDHRAEAVLEGLGISTVESRRRELEETRHVALDLVAAAKSRLIVVEQMNVESTAYSRAEHEYVVNRAEAALVEVYYKTLPPEVVVNRNDYGAGRTDLYLQHGETCELIEAKSRASHPYVRQALGQLLDYVANITQPVDVLSALFPDEPCEADISLLHRYGIDCIYRVADRHFERRPATAARRQVWSQASPGQP